MPNLSGFVYYDPARTGVSGTGLKNIPVALFNYSTGKGAVALTDVNGKYMFTNVPAGNYYVIECWGTNGLSSPINYLTEETVMAQPMEAEPPISVVTVPISSFATELCATTPNLINITMMASNISNVSFFDSAIGNVPLSFSNFFFVGANLITDANNGNFGELPAGTAINTVSPINPYPAQTPGFVYVNSITPNDGQFCVMNTRGSSYFPWWQVSDHTTKIETGRVLTVNGANPNSLVFTSTISVLQNTQYAFSVWVLNLINQTSGYANPQLAIKVLDQNNNQIFYQQVGQYDAKDIPIWYQNGFVFFNQNSTSLTIQIINTAGAEKGNDYLIDDVQLFQAETKTFPPSNKTYFPGKNLGGCGCCAKHKCGCCQSCTGRL
ncbi:MAG: hypothetical protein RR140_03450 [Clostridia bacterium]